MQKLEDIKADYAFKYIFSREGNESILIAFLNSILRLPPDQQITSIALQNTELTRKSPKHKTSVLDVLVKTEKNVYINVEIQLSVRRDMIPRTLAYWAHLFYNQMDKGDPYTELNQTITINLINFSQFDETDQFHTVFHLYEDEEQFQLTDLLEIHFLEIPKVLEKWESGEVNPQDDSLVCWLLLFKADQNKKLRNELEEIIMNNQEMSKLFEQWDKLSTDPKLRNAYASWMKSQHDEASDRYYIKADIAKRLLEEGMDLEWIAKTTDLSLKQVERLQQSP